MFIQQSQSGWALRAATVLLATFVLGSVARADVAYDNFPTRLNQGAGWGVGTGGNPLGCQFQSASTGMVDDIDLSVFTNPGGQSFTASLYADSGSNNLGALIKSWSGIGSNGAGTSFATIVNSDASISLTSGTLYWLEVSSTNDSGWSYASPGVTGRIAFNGNSFAGQLLGGFAISTVPLPEPSSAVLLAAGAAMLIRRSRKG